MVPKSKINKVRTVLQKELLLCTLLGGQRTSGMHSFPSLHQSIALEKPQRISSTDPAVLQAPCPDTESSAPVTASLEVTCANTTPLQGKGGADPVGTNAPIHQEAKTPKRAGLRTEGQSSEGVSPPCRSQCTHCLKKLVRLGMRSVSNFPNTYKQEEGWAAECHNLRSQIPGHFPVTWMLSQKFLGRILLPHSLTTKLSPSAW